MYWATLVCVCGVKKENGLDNGGGKERVKKIQFRTTGRIVKSEKRTVRSEFNVQSVKCPGSRSRSLPRCRMTGPGTRPLSGAARWAQCRSCWREREEQKVGQPPDIFLLHLLGSGSGRERKKNMLHVGKSELSASALTGARRRRRHLENAAHPQVGLTKSPARPCWSNKPEVAVWLSRFSAERSVSNKHCHSWLQHREAASNPAQEFNPKSLGGLNRSWWVTKYFYFTLLK